MHKHHIPSFRFAAAFIVGVVSIPLATYGIVGSLSTSSVRPSTRELHPRVREYRQTYRQQRRAYKHAIEDCESKFQATGENTCPDFNDPNSFKKFLSERQSTLPVRRSRQRAKLPESAKQLGVRDRARLRQFSVMGRCPVSLQGKPLYEVCQEMLGERKSNDAVVGLLNSKATQRLHSAAPVVTLKDRLRQINEAFDRSGRRENIVRPSTRSLRIGIDD